MSMGPQTREVFFFFLVGTISEKTWEECGNREKILSWKVHSLGQGEEKR